MTPDDQREVGPTPTSPVSPSSSTSPTNPALPVSPSARTVKQPRRRCKLDPSQRHSPTEPSFGRDSPPTPISLPPHFRLPITIVHVLVPETGTSEGAFDHLAQSDSHIRKTTPLFSYLQGVVPDEPTRHGSSEHHKGKKRAFDEDLDEDGPVLTIYESPVKGELVRWDITEGMVLDRAGGWATKPLLYIKEPCTHSVQWHGQCAICGSDLTISDYTGISETSRASIPMSHGPSTLTVSISEARRLESETRQRLLSTRKLSLIVDLDQTIVHATVDPTVGEWMADASNPNFGPLQGVGRFQLHDGSKAGNDACYYYLKMRPGLSQFLHAMADKYEMHVYTMGTRAYADAVCRMIDPTGVLFGSRVLSRDESGSMTQKSLTRLFPVDTSMVVIIDDRGDVWEYSPNLVSVVPYNFFVGIGDINGAFLPPPTRPPLPLDPTLPPPLPPPTHPTSTVEPGTLEAVVRTEAQSRLLTDQLLSRPLKQKQIELEAQVLEEGYTRRSGSSSGSRSSSGEAKEVDDGLIEIDGERQSVESSSARALLKIEEEKEPKPKPEVVEPMGRVSGMARAVLVDHDQELSRLQSILGDVHSGFYSQDVIEKADVRQVISDIKYDVLQGVHIAFSSLWPMDAIPEQQEAWKLAEQFGACCYSKITSRVTHLIAAKLGTSKVNTALARPNLMVLSPKWLFDAVTLWIHPRETEYLWAQQPQPHPAVPEAPDQGEADENGDGMEDRDDAEVWELEGFDWNDAKEEVEAAMMEDSSDDGEEEGDMKTVQDEEDMEMIQDEEEADRGRKPAKASEGPLAKRARTGRSRSRLREEVGESESEEEQRGKEQQDGEKSEDEDEFLSRLAAEVEDEMS